jgi:hypothetical protein
MAAVRARPDKACRYLAAQFAQAVHGLIPFAHLPRDGLAHVRAQIASICVCCAATAATRPPTRTAHRARPPGSRPSLSVTLAIGITPKPTFDPAPVRRAAADTICGMRRRLMREMIVPCVRLAILIPIHSPGLFKLVSMVTIGPRSLL